MSGAPLNAPLGARIGPWIVPGEEVGRSSAELQVRRDGPLADPRILMDYRGVGQYSAELYRSQPETAPELIHTGQLINPYTGERARTFEAATPPPDRWGDEDLGHSQQRLRAAQGTLLKPQVLQKREVLGVVDPLGGSSTEESQLSRQVWADSYRRVHGELYTSRDGIYEPPEMTRNPSGFVGHVNFARPTPFLPPTKSKDQALPWSSNQATAYGSAPMSISPVLKPERAIAKTSGERAAAFDVAAAERPRASGEATRQQQLGRPFSRPTMALERATLPNVSRLAETRRQSDYARAPEACAAINNEHTTSRARLSKQAKQALPQGATAISPPVSLSGDRGEELSVKRQRPLPIRGAMVEGEEMCRVDLDEQLAVRRQRPLPIHGGTVTGEETAQQRGECQVTTTKSSGQHTRYGGVAQAPAMPSAFADAESILASLRFDDGRVRAVLGPEAHAPGENVVVRPETVASKGAHLGAELLARPSDMWQNVTTRSADLASKVCAVEGLSQAAKAPSQTQTTHSRELAQAPRNADAPRSSAAQATSTTTAQRLSTTYQVVRGAGAALLSALIPRAAVRVDTARGARELGRSIAEGMDVAAPSKPTSSRSRPEGEIVTATPAIAYDVGQQVRGAARTRPLGHREAPRRFVSAPTHVEVAPQCAIAPADTLRGLTRLPSPVPCKVHDQASAISTASAAASAALLTSRARQSSDRSTPGLQVKRSQ